MPDAAPNAVFVARGLTKIYRMGEVEVHALRGVDHILNRREHVGFVFPFYNRIPSLIARENVAAATGIAESPMRPEEALALMGLEVLEKVNRELGTLTVQIAHNLGIADIHENAAKKPAHALAG